MSLAALIINYAYGLFFTFGWPMAKCMWPYWASVGCELGPLSGGVSSWWHSCRQTRTTLPHVAWKPWKPVALSDACHHIITGSTLTLVNIPPNTNLPYSYRHHLLPIVSKAQVLRNEFKTKCQAIQQIINLHGCKHAHISIWNCHIFRSYFSFLNLEIVPLETDELQKFR